MWFKYAYKKKWQPDMNMIWKFTNLIACGLITNEQIHAKYVGVRVFFLSTSVRQRIFETYQIKSSYVVHYISILLYIKKNATSQMKKFSTFASYFNGNYLKHTEISDIETLWWTNHFARLICKNRTTFSTFRRSRRRKKARESKQGIHIHLSYAATMVKTHLLFSSFVHQ